MISYKEVPGTYLHCIHADCPMANHCLRQLAMQSMPNDYIAVHIVNPNITKPSAECKFYRDDKPQVYGKGFVNMQKQMLPSICSDNILIKHRSGYDLYICHLLI